jgi:DNA repair exonuclease SbcCD ATPase subunit
MTESTPTDLPPSPTHLQVETLLKALNATRIEANEAIKAYEALQAGFEASLNEGWEEISRIKEEGAKTLESLRSEISQLHHQYLQTLYYLRHGQPTRSQTQADCEQEDTTGNRAPPPPSEPMVDPSLESVEIVLSDD